MRRGIQTKTNREAQQGYLLLFGLFVLSGLLTLSAVGLNRSMTDLMAANRYVAREQALHLAESSVEVAIFEATHPAIIPWTWFTHELDAMNQEVPVPEAERPLVRFAVDPAIATINDDGDYELKTPLNQTLTMRLTRLPDGLFRVFASGTSATNLNTSRIVAILTPVDLTRFFFLSPGPADLYYGQRVILDGGTGIILVNGDVNFQSGSYRAIELVLSDLMVYGQISRLNSGDPNEDGQIRWKTPGAYDAQNNPLFFQNGDPLFNLMPKATDALGNNIPDGLWSSKNAVGELNDPYWNNFLAGINPVGPNDLRPYVREVNTGALPPTVAIPRLPDINSFVDSLETIATEEGTVITVAAEVPCTAGQHKLFANALTLEMEDVVEIDLAALNGCLTEPTVLYVNQAVRLTNGTDLAQPLTVVSPDSIFVKGDFNTVNPKSAAIVTGNRNYHISGRFVDFQGFAVPSSEVDANGRVTDAGAERINTWARGANQTDSAFYDEYLTYNGNDPNATLALPPHSQWLPYWAPEIKQNLMVIAPIQVVKSDKTITNKNSYLEAFHRPGGYSPPKTGSYTDGSDNDGATKEFVKLRGAFINLPDDDSTLLDPSYQAGQSQDRRRKYVSGTDLDGNGYLDDIRSLNQGNIYIEPHHDYRYTQNLVADPPPGIRRAQQMARGVMVHWRELAPGESP